MYRLNCDFDHFKEYHVIGYFKYVSKRSYCLMLCENGWFEINQHNQIVNDNIPIRFFNITYQKLLKKEKMIMYLWLINQLYHDISDPVTIIKKIYIKIDSF